MQHTAATIPQDIQQIMESLPLPGSNDPQFIICQSRNYPYQSRNRFVVRVLGKSFTGNDVAALLLQAKDYYEKKMEKQAEPPVLQCKAGEKIIAINQLQAGDEYRFGAQRKYRKVAVIYPLGEIDTLIMSPGCDQIVRRNTTQVIVKK
mgnify:CR=1 FL=1